MIYNLPGLSHRMLQIIKLVFADDKAWQVCSRDCNPTGTLDRLT